MGCGLFSLQLERASNGKDLYFCVDHLNKLHLLYEINDFVQTGIDVSAIIAHRTDTDLCPLPKVIVSDLGDGHIKPVLHPINQFSDHMTLPFEGMILGNPKVELANPDHHLAPPPPMLIIAFLIGLSLCVTPPSFKPIVVELPPSHRIR
jgi:hypothetical protein